MDRQDILANKNELITVARRAFDLGLQTGTGGNLSIRLAGGEAVVIKPSGVGFAECSPTNLLIVDLDGNIREGTHQPSKDMPFHLGIYRVRPDVRAIVHVHSPWATAWACRGKEVPCLTIHSKAKLGRIPVVPVGPGGGNQAPESITELFKDQGLRAALLESHGAVGVGPSLLKAQHVVELIEETAQIAAVAAMILPAG